MEDVIARTPVVIEQVRAMLPAQLGKLANSILKGVRVQAEKLKGKI